MFELRLLVPEDRVEIVSDALEELEALSVSVEDADAQTPAEQALFGEPGMPPPKEGWQRSLVFALFPQEELARAAATLLEPQDFFAGCKLLGITPVISSLSPKDTEVVLEAGGGVAPTLAGSVP